jgi:hypothetical protein
MMTSKSKKSSAEDNEQSDFQVSDDDVPSRPNNLAVGLNLIYLALTKPYLTADQRIKFRAICRYAVIPEHREDAKEQLLKLYPLNTVIDAGMRVQVADAAIFFVQAVSALRKRDIDVAQTFMEQASAILPKLENRRIHQRDKVATQEECIQRFADRLLKIRPKGGWKDIDHAARVGQVELQVLLKEYKRTFGLLWKMDSGTLILQWLQQKQPYVQNAYKGVPIHTPVN